MQYGMSCRLLFPRCFQFLLLTLVKICKAVQTMDTRVRVASELALKVATWLETSKRVDRVLYPLLESHPCYSSNVKFLKHGGPGVLFFHVPVVKAKRKDWVKGWLVKHSKLVVFETSYGSTYSKIDAWPQPGTTFQFDSKDIKKNRPDVPGVWLRLALGWKTKLEEIVPDLEHLLDNLPPSDN